MASVWALWAALCAGVLAGGNDALIREGEARLAAGEIDAGLTLFRQAADAEPGSSLARTRLGGALLLKQEYRAAIAAFREAIGRDAANAEAFVGMALAYLHLGDSALARASLEEAKRIDPAKSVEVDRVIAWLGERETGGGPH